MSRRGAVAVLADDLIWASRLVAAVERAGALPVAVRDAPQLTTALEADEAAELAADDERRLLGVVIDLGGRRFDGVDAVARVATARIPIIAVAQHDDTELRKRALSAGALRVFSYAKFFTDGPRLIDAWLVADAA
jgi:DNA-binding response OmpR family regulator